MVLGSPVGSPLEGSILIFLGLELRNFFGTREGSLVGFSLGALGGLMVGTGEVSLVVLSLGLTLGYSLEYQNTGAVIGSLFESLIGNILGMYLGNPLGSLLGYIWNINWCGNLSVCL